MHWVVACDSQGNRLYRRPHTDTGVYQRKFGGNVHGPKTNLENPGVDHSQRIWSLGSTVLYSKDILPNNYQVGST